MIARKLHFGGGGDGGGDGVASGGGGDRPRRRRERSINGGFSCTVALPGLTGRARVARFNVKDDEPFLLLSPDHGTFIADGHAEVISK